MDGFKLKLEGDWKFDSGMGEGDRPEFTSGAKEPGGCERAGSGGDGDRFGDGELDGRGAGDLSEEGVVMGGGELDAEHSEDGVRSGELDEGEFSEDGVRSGGEFDEEEFSEDGVRGGGDGSAGAISGTVDFNSENDV